MPNPVPKTNRGNALLMVLLVLAIAAFGFYFLRRAGGGDGSSALEMAQLVPEEVHATWGWDIEGQLDLASWVQDIRALNANLSESEQAEFKEFEDKLGMPIEQWLSLYNGRGYFAVLKSASKEDPGLIGVVGLKDQAKFKTWWEGQSSEYSSKPETAEIQGVPFQLYPDIAVGFDANWLYLANSKASAETLVTTVAGKSPSLDQTARYQEGVKSLQTQDSAAFVYLNTESIFSGLENADIPYTDSNTFKELAPLKYLMASVDFSRTQTDGLLRVDGDSLLATKLRAPGGASGEYAKQISKEATSFCTLDLKWLFETVSALGTLSPETRMYAAMAPTALMPYDPWGSFSGEVIYANDIPEALSETLSANARSAATSADNRDCKTNLRNISTALEMYSTDWSGYYPAEMTQLTPNYLKTVPSCPAAGADTYSSTLVVTTQPDSYRIHCSGNHHPQGTADHPAYSSEQGLITGPRKDDKTPDIEPSSLFILPVKNLEKAHSLLAQFLPGAPDKAPAPGESLEYPVPEPGAKLVLDGQAPARLLATAGKDPARLQNTTEGHLADQKLLRQVLDWGGKGIIYADYLDLEPAYEALLRGLEGSEDEDVQRGLEVLKKLRARLPHLQGASCLTVKPEGLRYRAFGASNLGIVAGGGIVAAVAIPNFVGARSQGQTTACKSNLKNIGTALEMYSTDWSGNYPQDTNYLTPNYLRTMPECPSAGGDTYSAGYSRTEDPDTYEVYCTGHNHADAGIPPNFPRYNSRQGLKER